MTAIYEYQNGRADVRQLYDAHGAEAYRLARRLGGSEANAVEIVRRVFAHAAGRPIGPQTADDLCRQVIREARGIHSQPPFDPGSLDWAIDQLPDAPRTAWILHVLEGRSHEEVARLVGVRPGTSRSNVSRARADMAQLYTDLLDDIVSVARAHKPVAPPGLRASLGRSHTLRRARWATGPAGVALLLLRRLIAWWSAVGDRPDVRPLQ